MYCSRSSRDSHRWNSSLDKWKGRVVDAENPAGEFVNSENKATRCYMPTSISMIVSNNSSVRFYPAFFPFFRIQPDDLLAPAHKETF